MNDNRLIEFTRQTIPDLIALYRFGSQAKEAMVGFRNVAVHEYTRLNLEVVHFIITKQLDDFRTFSSTIVKGCA